MFNWILDIRAARTVKGAKNRAAYYTRRADLMVAHNLMHDARESRKILKQTAQISRETRKIAKKTAKLKVVSA